MPNHFHFLLTTLKQLKPQALNQSIGITLRSYTRAINKRFDRIGSLFQQKTKAKCIYSSDDWQSSDELSHALTCFHYIHQNPIKAGLVQKIGEWEFSSYRDYAGLRNGTLPNKKLAFQWLNFKDEEDFVRSSHQTLDPRIIEKLY
jgi:putative transposase